MSESRKLSSQQWQRAQAKANEFRTQMEATARAIDQQNFFAILFAISAQRILDDTHCFCNLAQEVFDEIDAFDREPQLDTDWLAELTGEKNDFYFSTKNLVSEPDPLPGNRGKGRKYRKPDEAEVIQAIEEAMQTLDEAIAVSHSENVQDWIDVIKSALSLSNTAASFDQLLSTTRLCPGELWLALLLGHTHWTLKQDRFYGNLTVALNDVGE